MNPIRFALRHPITVMVVIAGIVRALKHWKYHE
jgi:hypothetical protein